MYAHTDDIYMYMSRDPKRDKLQPKIGFTMPMPSSEIMFLKRDFCKYVRMYILSGTHIRDKLFSIKTSYELDIGIGMAFNPF